MKCSIKIPQMSNDCLLLGRAGQCHDKIHQCHKSSCTIKEKLLRPGKLHGTPHLSMITLNLKVLGTFGYVKVYLKCANFAA
jgi:hypothetical protein